jgi:hypothetical protein
MAQYKHDRFLKFYVQALYKTKGETRKNIQVRNDEDLEIDCMFLAQSDKWGWQQEDLGLFDRLMKKHPTIIIEHYSGYLNQKNLNISCPHRVATEKIRAVTASGKSTNRASESVYLGVSGELWR